MATAQEPVRATLTPQESYVDAQIAHARGRIRAHDLGVAALALTAAALAFAVGMVLLDRAFQFGDLTRQLALGTFALAALGYAAFAFSTPFRRQVNPYYAARLVERSLPGAKNSVVNWLDLRDEPLPASVHSALGQRAARDLRAADVDAVVRDPRVNGLGWAAGLLFAAAVVQFVVLKPGPYASLLSRAFRPFTSAVIAKRTALELVKPAGGDAVVAVNRSLDFEVHVGGTVPTPGADDAVRLRLRYNPADPAFEEKSFAQDPADARRWTLRLPANQVQNGFSYRVVGGDDATPEYAVGVRSTPLVETHDVLYQYRPYLHFRDSETHIPNLEAIRGTRVALTAHTNRVVDKGRVVFDAAEGQKEPRKPVDGERVEGQPNALRFAFEVERDAKYRVHFQAADGEANEDPLPHAIKALSDFAPQVDVTRPSPDAVPLNGSLTVAGKASDDFGVTAVRLAVQLRRGAADDKPQALLPKKYRDGKSFRFADGTFPRTLEVKEVLPLELLRSELNLPVEVKKGDAIEYWLEADDNCDYPNAETGKTPNTGRSKVYRVTVGDPVKEEEKKERDAAARQEKADHERQQDADHRQQEGDKKAGGDPDPDAKGDQPKPAGDKKPAEAGDRKPDGKPGDPNKGDNGKQGDGKPDAASPAGDAKGNDNPDDKRIEDTKRKVEKELRDGAKGNAKPDGKPNDPNGPQKGDAKPEAAPKPDAGGKGDAKPDANAGKPGAPEKGDAKPDAKPQPGDAKPNPDDRKKPGGQGGDPKTGDQPNPKAQPEAKGGEPKTGDAKPNPKPDGKASGEGKGEPKTGDNPGEAKPLPADGPGDGPNKTGDAKKPEPTKPEGGQPKGGEPKPGNNQGKSEPKTGDNPGGKAEPKPGGSPGKAESKDGPSKPDGGSGKAEPKPGAGKGDNSPKPAAEKGGGDPKAGEPKAGTEKNGESNGKGEPKPGTEKGNGEPKPGEPKGDATKPDGKAGDGKQPASTGNDAAKKGDDGKSPAPGKPSAAEKGPGGEAGSKGSTGEQPNNGPKEKGNDNVPKSKPKDKDDRNEGKGQGSSDKPSDKAAPKGMKAEDGTGKSKAGDGVVEKGEAKPDPADGDQPGSNNPNAEIRDAVKPHEKPGDKPSAEPKTGGKEGGPPKPADGKPTGEKSGTGQAGGDDKKGPDGNDPDGKPKNQKPSADELKKASEALKAIAEDLGKMLKDKPPQEKPDAKAMKDAAERLKEFAKQMEDLKKSDPKAFDEIVENLDEARKNLEKGGGEDLKKAAAQAAKAADEARKTADEPRPDLPPLPGNRAAPKPADGKEPPPDAPPGGGQQGGPAGAQGSGSPDNGVGDGPDPRFARRAGELQLEQFKKVDKSTLERLKMTEAEYKQFLAEYEDLLKRKAAPAAAAKDERVRGASTGGPGANTAARQVKGGPEGKSKLERGGAAQPPPEFRDGYKGFTEDVSKTPKPAEKK